MSNRLKQYLAALLAVILTVQAPIALAFTCVSVPMNSGEMAAADVSEEKCHEMSDGMKMSSGVAHLTNDLNKNPDQNDDFQLCQAECCCVVLPAPAIQNEFFVKPVFPVATSRQDFAGRLISTYLKSDIRPPIS
jgi:hypothetical protein